MVESWDHCSELLESKIILRTRDTVMQSTHCKIICELILCYWLNWAKNSLMLILISAFERLFFLLSEDLSFKSVVLPSESYNFSFMPLIYFTMFSRFMVLILSLYCSLPPKYTELILCFCLENSIWLSAASGILPRSFTPNLF